MRCRRRPPIAYRYIGGRMIKWLNEIELKTAHPRIRVVVDVDPRYLM